MATTVINLRLEEVDGTSQLQWENNGEWTAVSRNSPSTSLDEGDEIDWDGDDTIKKIKIKFEKGNIIPNSDIRDNDTKKVKASPKRGLGTQKLSDKYDITAYPEGGGKPVTVDPDVNYPAS